MQPLEEVERRAHAFNVVAGTWPVKFESASHRRKALGQWHQLVQEAQECYETLLDEEERTLVVLADLYRQGHNMEQDGCAENAHQAITLCLDRYPNSVRGNLVGAYFYLSVNPAAAPRGEACLVRLRELLGDGVDRNVERGFVFAHLAQGRHEQALAQARTYLSKFGPDQTIEGIRTGLEEGTLESIVKK